MNEDPIVASVRKIREELAAPFNYDVQAIFADLRKREAHLAGRLVQPGDSNGPSFSALLNDSGTVSGPSPSGV